MMRTTVVVAFILGAWSAQAFTIRPASTRRNGVPLHMVLPEVFDPTVVGGIAATIMGGLGFATKAGGKKDTTAKTVATKKSGADVSIPYDAAARLAYGEATDKGVDFETFREKYEQLTVATITAKKLERELFPTPVHVDLSIPYDAAARLAYDKWRADYGKGEFDSASYETFKTQYEKLSVAQATAKKLQREM